MSQMINVKVFELHVVKNISANLDLENANPLN